MKCEGTQWTTVKRQPAAKPFDERQARIDKAAIEFAALCRGITKARQALDRLAAKIAAESEWPHG